MKTEEKKRIEEQIAKLQKVINDLSKLNTSNPKVSNQIKNIKEYIEDLEFQLTEAATALPWRVQFYNEVIRSKTIMLNVSLIVFEIMLNFTDIFKDSDNPYLKTVAILIPAITIYLRTIDAKNKIS